MKNIVMIVIMLCAVSCIPLRGTAPVSDDAVKFQEAKEYFDAGNYESARNAYREIGAGQRRSPLAEQAAYNAAYILVYHKNQHRDYVAAEAEFSALIQSFPQGTLTDEARSWVDIIQRVDRAASSQALKDVETLTRQVEELTRKMQEATANEQKIQQERDSLLVLNETLSGKIEGFISEKEKLVSEKTVLVAERDTLAQDKTQLQNRVAVLTQEKSDLVKAKRKLEKSLHDLTMVDVRMEKRRKKIKKEEAINSRSTATR
jgi:hypothetical protein